MLKCDDVVEYVCGTIEIPRTLTIQNSRLGALQRALQVGALIWVLYNAILLRSWQIVSVPLPDSFELWVDAPDPSGSAAAAAKPHCTNPSVFDYNISETLTYEFKRCVDLPNGEAFDKNGKALFVPTMTTDRFIWKASGATACSALKTSCDGKGGRHTYDTDTDCTCERMERVFTKRPEDIVIHFNHGFMVSYPSGDRQRGKDTSDLESSGQANGGWKKVSGGQDAEMATVILKPDGSRCEIGASSKNGARSLWSKHDVSEDGITGSIGEWLVCAQFSLDEPQPDLGTGRPEESGTPTSRLAGLELRFDLSYHNKDDKGYDISGYGAVCYVKVQAIPLWNTVTSVAYSELPDTGTSSGSWRYRKNYGISLTTTSRGSFAKFDYMSVVNQIVNAIVILGLPAAIVQFLALSGIGLLSKIYSRAQAQVVDISQELTGLSARLAAGVATFRYMSGEQDEMDTPEIDLKVLRKSLRQAFEAEITSGILSETEFEGLVSALFRNLDTGATSTITLREYITASMSHEIVDPRNLVDFFDTDRRRGILERLFTTSKLRAAITGGAPTVRTSQVQPEAVEPVQVQVVQEQMWASPRALAEEDQAPENHT